MVFGSIGFAWLNFLTFIGIGYSSAEHANIILALMPLLSFALTCIINRNFPDTKTSFYMLIAFAGIVLVITNGNFSHLMASSSFIGDLLLLAATVCWVIYTYFANVMNSVYRWNIQKEIFII